MAEPTRTLEGPARPSPTSRPATGNPPRHEPADFEPDPVHSRAGRRSIHDKLWAGLSGWKHAIRGDSSFFAHAYRAFLVAFTASLLGVRPEGWIALVLAGCLIFIAELNHSAVDTLARAVGDPEEPRLKVAREIAAGGVLAAVVGATTVVVVILVFRFGEMFNWLR